MLYDAARWPGIDLASANRGAIAQLEERLHGMQPALNGQLLSLPRGDPTSDLGPVIVSRRA